MMLLNPYRFAAGGGGGGDAYTVLLMHMDGANGSTTFTDEKGHSTSAVNGAGISTAQSKFGGASGHFPAAFAAVSVSASADFDFGAGDWTIECFARFSAGGNWTIWRSGDGRFWFYSDANRWVVKINGGANVFVISWSPTTDVWYHVAAARQGGTTRLFIGGVQIGSGTSIDVTSMTDTSVSVGAGGGYSFNGYLDELRVSKGVARYTADFTPPTSPFPDS